MFYKVIENGVIVSLHQSAAQPPNSERITNEKYNELLATIRSRPEDTLASIYKLMNATEQYEPFVRTHEQRVSLRSLLRVNTLQNFNRKEMIYYVQRFNK